jgi:hypothetical protein
VEQNIASDPTGVGCFRADAVALQAQDLPTRIEHFPSQLLASSPVGAIFSFSFSACVQLAASSKVPLGYSGFCCLSLWLLAFALATWSPSSSVDRKVCSRAFRDRPVAIVFTLTLPYYPILPGYSGNVRRGTFSLLSWQRRKRWKIFHSNKLLPSASRTATPS